MGRHLTAITLVLAMGCGAAYAAGTCTVSNVTTTQIARTTNNIADADTVIVSLACTADASDGSFPATTVPVSGSYPSSTTLNTYNLTGYVLYQVGRTPGTPNPTASYTVTITDAKGFALDMALLTTNGSATAAQMTAITTTTTGAPTVRSALTVAITANSVNSAKITLDLVFRAKSAAGGSGGGAIYNAGTPTTCAGDVIIIDTTTTPGTVYWCNAGTPTAIAAVAGAVGFDAIGPGTNVSGAMHVGTGSSLDATGTGAVSATEINGVAMKGLATGIVKNTTTTGVPSIAVAGDFPTLNQNTSGNAATATALAAAPSKCSAGTYPLGIDASGAAQNCTAVISGGVSGNLLCANGTGTGTDCGIPSSNIGVQPTGIGFVFSHTGSPNTYSTATVAGTRCFPIWTSGDVLSCLTAWPLTDLATQAADTVLMNATASVAGPTAVALPTGGTNGCAGATDSLQYNNSTHTWACNTSTGGGNVNAAGSLTDLAAVFGSGGTTGVQTDPLIVTDLNGKLTVVELDTTPVGGVAGEQSYPEGTAPACGASGYGKIYAGTSSTHRFAFCNNGGSAQQIVGAGVDVNTADQVTATHLAAALPVNQGGTGTNSTLTGFVRGNASAMTGTELSCGTGGGVITSGDGSTTFCANPSFSSAYGSLSAGTATGSYLTGSGLTVDEVYYFSSGGLAKAKADSASTLPGICIAVTTTQCVYSGAVKLTTSLSWTAGNIIYVSDATAGALLASAPSASGKFVQRVGIALAADTILVMPSLDVGSIQ